MLAAAVMLTCGLGWSLGTGWVANADAQTQGKPVDKPTAQDEVKRLQAELEKAKQAAKQEARTDLTDLVAKELAASVASESAAFKTKKRAYDLVVDSDVTQADFHKYLQDREDRGWEFNGSIVLKGDRRLLWVFRRPMIASGTTLSPDSRWIEQLDQSGSSTSRPVGPERTGPGNDVKAIEAEIKSLQERLARATLAARDKESAAPARIHLTYSPTGKSVTIACTGVTDSGALAAVLRDLGERQFGKDSVQVADESGNVTVSGSKEYVEWAVALVKGMAGPPLKKTAGK